MRKLASVVEIASCDPVPETDRLSVATMKGKGWRIITGRNEFKPGDIAVYFEIDSFIPDTDSRFEFLRERCLRKFVSKSGNVLRQGFRIKTCKLRGVVSQGLLMPLSSFPEVSVRDDIVGTDLTEILNVEHYDEVKEQLAPACGGGSVSCEAYGKFPSDFIPKTDEERVQNLGDWFTIHSDKTWELTSKDDGSSVTMFFSRAIDPEVPFGVCSRNLRLKETNAKGAIQLPWLMAIKYGIIDKLRHHSEMTGHELALQGELVGPGIQSDRDKYNEHEWHVFKIWDITDQRFLSPSERRAFCADNKIPHVAVVAESMPVFQKFPTCEDLLKFAEGKTARGNEREGLVFKCNEDPSLSFKAVSNRYLLKTES